MARAYMIRHGKPASTWGEQADPDPGLDGQGRAQAEAAAKALMALPQAERPTRVVSSPLRRCRETAEPFAKALGVVVEIDAAVAEVPTPKPLDASERGPWLRAAFETDWGKVEGDIDYAAWRDRVGEAVVRHAGAAIFSHFVAINAAVSAATGEDAVRAFQPDHCSITRFEVQGETLSLIELGRAAATGVL
jgi:broad specificity phosphatase PhoE